MVQHSARFLYLTNENYLYNVKAFLVSLFVLITAQVSAQAVMTFDTTRYDFGTVKAGDKAEYTFQFTNTGTSDIIIKEVKTTCFCTASKWPAKAIKPGERGSIFVEFDTKDKNGPYAKGVNVYSNAGESNLIIFIEVDGVEEPPQEPDDSDHDHDH